MHCSSWPQEVLDLAPPTAERVYVGKRGGRETSMKQSEIDALLVKLCSEQVIVKLICRGQSLGQADMQGPPCAG